MESIVEDPSGHLLRLSPLVFELSELDDDNVFSDGWSVVSPLDPRPDGHGDLSAPKAFAGWVEKVMDYAEAVIRREAFEVGLDRESLGVPPAHIFGGA